MRIQNALLFTLLFTRDTRPAFMITVSVFLRSPVKLLGIQNILEHVSLSRYCPGVVNRKKSVAIRPGLLEAWLVLTSVKYHGNLYNLIPLNQWLALTRLRATGPW